MKRLIFLLSLFVTCVRASAQDVWGMQDCIDYALTHSRELKKQDWSQRSNHTQLVEAVMAFMPNLSASSGVNYSFGRSLDPETNTYNTVSNFSNSYSLGLSVPLFQGGRLVQQLKMQLVQQQYDKTALQNLKDQTAMGVMTAFVQVAYFQQLDVYVREKRKESLLSLQQIRRQSALGLRSEADVMLVEAQYAEDDYNVTHTAHLLENALLELKRQMGYPVGDTLAVAVGSLVGGQAAEAIGPSATGEEILRTYTYADGHHPTLRMSRFNLQSQLYARRYAFGNFLPSLSFSAGVSSSYFRRLGEKGYAPYREQFRNNLGEYFAFNVSLPLFQRLGNVMNYRRRKFQYRIAQEEHARQQEQLLAEIQQAVLQREALCKECLHLERQLKADSVAYRVVACKFEEGLVGPVDLRSAAASLQSSRASLLECRLNLFVQGRVAAYYRGEPLY